ncbi:MAG: DUF433 domain-containing protein [Chloroflexi bacterium]|nr:DUF433 domain-containing protein [Chloroflexota bacterium]
MHQFSDGQNIGNDEVGMKYGDRIVIDPNIQGGRAVIAGTRVPLKVILGSLSGGDTIEDICKGYAITEEDVRAALEYAAEVVDYASIYTVSDRRESAS